MADFRIFAARVRERFELLSTQELFVVDVDGDVLYNFYLDAFPAGTNEIYRTRREFDCSADKNFVRNLGNVVAIVNGSIASVWDVEAEYPFNVVAERMNYLISNARIVSVFRTKEVKYGAEMLRELRENSEVHTWYNFNGKVDKKHRSDTADAIRGDLNTKAQVMGRGLAELQMSAVKQVQELISDDLLYRGAEHKAAVDNFAKLLAEYTKLNSDEARDLFIWANLNNFAGGFRNTVIGTLVDDLSKGVDLEAAVKKFESKVAPQNYKRSKSLITPSMIKDAMKTIGELNLEPALERRFAKVDDIDVNAVLFVDNKVRGSMKGGIENLLMTAAAPKTVNTDKAIDININDFITDVVPKAAEIEVMVKNSHEGNFMSLTAPVHEEVESLFKWDNNFAWSYDGNTTDSDLRQRVAAAGGRVDGVLRFSHTWNYDGKNQSLMDLHVFMPGHVRKDFGGESEIHDHYGNGERVGWNHRNHAESGGVQDVDHTSPPGTFVPVENITFPDLRRMPEGKYVFKVHNWQLRSVTTSGFKAELEFGGQVYQYEYPKALKHKEWVTVAEVTLRNGEFTIEHKLPHASSSKDKWGVKTESFVPVDSLILSPNYWGENATGNKHWFFILKDCLNPQPVRGIYNEFLKPGLEKHRKVFEILGDKTKAEPTKEQLSGIGFSSTKRDTLVAQVKGDKMQKIYNIQF